eukprot:g8643.t1
MTPVNSLEVDVQNKPEKKLSTVDKLKKIKADASDPDHPRYWDKMVILELVEMTLSALNLYSAFRLNVWQSTYYYILIYIFLAMTLDLFSIAEYLYMRLKVFPSETLTEMEKKAKVRWILMFFTTKEIIADTMHLYAGMELKSFIMYFESSLDDSEAKNTGAVILTYLAIIYGIFSLLQFLYDAMESYIEIIDVAPYNGGKRLMTWLTRWKKLAIFLMLVSLVISQILQIEFDSIQEGCLEGMQTYDPLRRINRTLSADDKNLNCPCSCVKKQCYSKSCSTMDSFRRIECSLTNENGDLEDCGKVYAAPAHGERVIEDFEYAYGGIFPVRYAYYKDGRNNMMAPITRAQCDALEKKIREEFEKDRNYDPEEWCTRLKMADYGASLTSDQIGYNKFLGELFVVCKPGAELHECYTYNGAEMWETLFNVSTAHTTCSFCNDMWLEYDGAPQLSDSNGVVRENKCLCNETSLHVVERKIKLDDLLKNLREVESEYGRGLYGTYTLNGKQYNATVINIEGDTISQMYSDGAKVQQLKFKAKIKTCSSKLFHGFTNELTCGRVLNTLPSQNLSMVAALIIVIGFGSYLLIWAVISSICLRRCILNKNWCRRCCCCRKCDDEQPCCKCRCGRHPDDGLEDDTTAKGVKQRRYSNRRSSFTATSNAII